MGNHIDNQGLETLLEQFIHEHPMGDSRDLAKFMFNKGWESANNGPHLNR